MPEHGPSLPGMVLAAGYGQRLAPLTDLVPKPLLPVGGRALLDLAVANLDRAGIGPVVVNTHHLAGQVAAHVQARPDAGRFTLSHETSILGTGGALDGARSFLAQAPDFLLHNGDVLTDADLSALLAAHRASGCMATLMLVDCPAVNTVDVGGDGRVLRLAGRPRGGPEAERRLTYAGVAAFSRRLLADVPAGPSSLVDVLATVIAREPGAVRAWVPAGARWDDVGTFARWLGAQPEEDAASPPAPPPAVTVLRIRGHGSDRRFWRLGCGDWSAVVMSAPPGDAEHARFVAIAAFLEHHDLGPARRLRVDDNENTVVMEDLGTCSLYALGAAAADDEPPAVAAWELATDHVARLQATTAAARAECPVAFDLALDLPVLRWETAYFAERFLGGLMGLDAAGDAALADEFAALAATVAAQPVYLVHRDYQSQNLLVRDGRLRLVDFQGLRPGPLGYDLASLLWDPYVALPPARRESLLVRYAGRARGLEAGLSAADVRAMVLAAALQRLMQALGAYGFLSLVKGRRGFLRHVPRGLAHLRDVLDLASAARAGGAGDPARLPPALPRLAALLARLDDDHVRERLAKADAART
ncbi:MAG: phosphotransferase [bacterium]|nr:phosphotransferase [bacterium]